VNVSNLIYGDYRPRRAFSLALFCAWLALVLVLARHHVVWRDEVRAYSFALQGHTVNGMLEGLHGEGHPALWYLLIRAAHALFFRPQAMEIAALAIALASMLLLVLRSPFNLFVLAILLSGRFAMYEYSVMARNYGISMLLLFAIAAVYPRYRDRGLVLGLLLLLLANSNVQSVLLVVAFLVFWLADIGRNKAGLRSEAVRNYILNAAIAVFGIAVCAITVLPTINDAGAVARPAGIALLGHAAKSLLEPANFFSDLLMTNFLSGFLGHFSLLHQPYLRLFKGTMSMLLFTSTLGLIRRPAALLGSWIALIGFVLFFSVLYPGLYRHEALWLVFLIVMYWIAGGDRSQNVSRDANIRGAAMRAVQAAGYAAFLIILALQTLGGIAELTALRTAPESRSRDLGQLITSHPELHDAVVIADPDYLIEPLPYYISNPTYLMHEHRFGDIVHFTRSATLDLTLGDILDTATHLHATTGRPVVILLQDRLQPSAPAQSISEAYDWHLTTTPEEVRQFQASTHLLESYGRVSDNDETFDVYVLN
jgi:hypothetical protein